MRPFRFRAEAALELRRREEADALAAHTQAEALFSEADRAWTAAGAARQAAEADLALLQRHGTGMDTVLWHRNWFVRLASDVERLAGDRDECDRARQVAREAWQTARRRKLALERLREQAWRAFQQDAVRAELKVIDELARIRFLMDEAGGSLRDD
jgi:flagellar export protein FliJ